MRDLKQIELYGSALFKTLLKIDALGLFPS